MRGYVMGGTPVKGPPSIVRTRARARLVSSHGNPEFFLSRNCIELSVASSSPLLITLPRRQTGDQLTV